MGGIAGKLTFNGDRTVDRPVVCAMASALAHRGPDAEGCFFASGIGLACRETSVEPAVLNGQPAGSEDGCIRAVGDLALTNARELAAELTGLGHRMCGRRPSDVVVHAYEQWGDDFVERLRGAFACAVWDGRRRRLVLARDPLGIKPIVYAVTAEGISFASELKALVQDPDVPLDCDPAALQEFLALGYVPAPATALCAVSKLPAGHLAIAEGGRLVVREYWDLPAPGATQPAVEPDERLAALARAAVRAQLRASQQATLMLSGGMSSAIVGALVVDAGALPLTTVTSTWDQAPSGEAAIPRRLAKALGTRHHTEWSTVRLPDLLPRLAWHLDEPCASASALTMFLACTAARAHGAWVLAGHGGRQIGGGRRPLAGLRGIAQLALGGSVAAAAPGIAGWPALRSALSPDFLAETSWVDPLDGLRALSAGCDSRRAGDRARYLQVKVALPDDVLARLDRASAAVSLAVSVPLLDRDFVEGAISMGAYAGRRRGGGTWPLRLLTRRELPSTASAVLPMGQTVAGWLRGPLAPLMSDLLLSGRFRHRGLFDSRAVTRLWQQHLTGRRDHHAALWPMLMLELWFRQFVDAARVHARAA